MMSTPQQRARGYRISFIINTLVGGFLLLLAIVAAVFEILFPAMRGGLVWGFVPAIIGCFTIGYIHRRRYLHSVAPPR